MNPHSKRINPIIWLLLALNALPIIGVFADIWKFSTIAYFYWAECALIGILAAALYVKYLIAFFLLSAAMAGILYLANPFLLADMQSIAIFWSLYSLCWISYIEIGKGAYGKLIRLLDPKRQLFIYFLALAISILICYLITTAIVQTISGHAASILLNKPFMCVALLVPTISIGLLKMVGMIGEKHFVNFLLGTYYRPVEKERVVLFLDMVGSSSIAEKLPPKKSMNLIADYIYDCSHIFRIHGGDILNYTGDGLVVLWETKHANSTLTAVHKLKTHFSSKETRARYWKKYGMYPSFRIGIHAGNIVLSQIGEEKLFIGLYGDVVNTAARLEQLNKQLDTVTLLSSAVVQNLNQSWKALLKPMGSHEVRGRDEAVEVYTLYQDS